jgi:hypothetical protein
MIIYTVSRSSASLSIAYNRYVHVEGDKDKPANGLNLCLVQTHISHVGTMGHVTRSTFTQATDSFKPKQMSCSLILFLFCRSMQNFDGL